MHHWTFMMLTELNIRWYHTQSCRQQQTNDHLWCLQKLQSSCLLMSWSPFLSDTLKKFITSSFVANFLSFLLREQRSFSITSTYALSKQSSLLVSYLSKNSNTRSWISASVIGLGFYFQAGQSCVLGQEGGLKFLPVSITGWDLRASIGEEAQQPPIFQTFIISERKLQNIYLSQFAVSINPQSKKQENGYLGFTDYGRHTIAEQYIFSKMGGAFLSQPVTQKVVKRHQHGKIRVVSCEMQGWRKYMEDAVLFHRISKDIFLFAVFDGHGGMEVSQLCAKKIIELLQANRSFQGGNYARALEETFKELDEFLGSEHGEEILKNTTIENGLQPFENSKVADSVGCTANVVLLVGKTLYVANAGDSRAALSRLGSLIELSYDHKPEDPLEMQRIVASGAKVEGGRINNHLNLSRCLGDLYYKKSANLSYERQTITGHPDVKTIQLCKDDDFIVIGCDGIWQRYQKNSQDLITLIRQQRLKGKTPEQVLSQMLEGFLAKDPSKQQLGCDNMSVILVELNKNAF